MSPAKRQSRRRRSSEIEATIFEACWRLYQRDETDLLEGGVASARIANELGITRDRARSALQRLGSQGVVVSVQGAAPEDYRARRSFVPAPFADGTGGEQP
ncbi:hypothetical protein [Halolamina salifodinae]|uniref:DNA-binding FadR family transcriptional regulator n=1 Tax=Halolamina salifodinae TaxID=1202767 RepID=A0A8T4GSS7_9EURY|nr:hypothetical protein [Halolamina salifodinae]MBP1985929.1 DNA-binding FadR family transcriptional regulator [Halolamina salifodinae]